MYFSNYWTCKVYCSNTGATRRYSNPMLGCLNLYQDALMSTLWPQVSKWTARRNFRILFIDIIVESLETHLLEGSFTFSVNELIALSKRI